MLFSSDVERELRALSDEDVIKRCVMLAFTIGLREVWRAENDDMKSALLGPGVATMICHLANRLQDRVEHARDMAMEANLSE